MKKCKNCIHMHIHPISVKSHTFYQCVYYKSNKRITSLVLPEFGCEINFQRKPEQTNLF